MENFDVNFTNLNKKEVINKYLENLKILRCFAEQSLSPFSFNNYIVFTYFDSRNNGQPPEVSSAEPIQQGSSLLTAELLKQILDRRRKIFLWIFYLSVGFLCISYKNEASSIVLRNIQTIFYPGMKLWRKLTLPVIEKFPGLTELYDQSCLLMNPFFQVENLNCDPCSNVVNVLDLTNVPEDPGDKYAVPFIFKINQDAVKINDLYSLYKNNEEVFVNDAYRVKSTNREITYVDELFNDFNRTHQKPSHTLWRFNRMSPARLLRQLFVRPSRLPSTGISLERYISIDTKNSPSYAIPDTECANMYIQQAYGTRTIILRSTVECRQTCRTLSVRLPQSFVFDSNGSKGGLGGYETFEQQFYADDIQM
ncbi:hypothetical protein ACFFRR_000140 [Megaselia abdita]